MASSRPSDGSDFDHAGLDDEQSSNSGANVIRDEPDSDSLRLINHGTAQLQLIEEHIAKLKAIEKWVKEYQPNYDESSEQKAQSKEFDNELDYNFIATLLNDDHDEIKKQQLLTYLKGIIQYGEEMFAQTYASRMRRFFSPFVRGNPLWSVNRILGDVINVFQREREEESTYSRGNAIFQLINNTLAITRAGDVLMLAAHRKKYCLQCLLGLALVVVGGLIAASVIGIPVGIVCGIKGSLLIGSALMALGLGITTYTLLQRAASAQTKLAEMCNNLPVDLSSKAISFVNAGGDVDVDVDVDVVEDDGARRRHHRLGSSSSDESS